MFPDRPAVVVDLDQNPRHRVFGARECWPPLITHGLQWSLQRHRLVTMKENLRVLGWPVGPGDTGVSIYEHSVFQEMEQKRSQMMKLIGNSMSLQPAAYFLFYVMCHLGSRAPDQIQRGLSSLIDVEEADSPSKRPRRGFSLLLE